MENLHKLGMDGQKAAEDFLQGKGYRILKTNYRIRTGEIDIIAKDRGGYIVFAEVKYRRGLSHGYPREAVTKAKQNKIVRTAMHYISANVQEPEQDFRFDVVEVLAKDGKLYVNHIENAFE